MPSNITLSKIEKQSKGRNGWFHPARAQVFDMPNTICLEIWSKREDGHPPIDLYLSPEDAAAIGRLLVSTAMAARMKP